MSEINYCPHCHKKITSHPHYAAASAFWEKQDTFPYRLYHSIVGRRVNKITPDMERGLEYALSSLEDYERELLKRLYERDGSLPAYWEVKGEKQIASIVLNKAMKKLREPDLMARFVPETAVKEDAE